MDCQNKYIEIILLVLFILLAGMAIVSCSLPPQQGGSPDPSPTDQLIKVVTKTSWMPTLSIVGIACGVFALLNGFKWGIPAIASCCVSLFMSLATARYSEYMAITGLVGSVLITAGSIIVKNQALIEIITGVEKVKEEVPVDLPTGSKEVNKVLDRHQTKYTKRTVKSVKKKLGL
jgi:hypothetical protein